MTDTQWICDACLNCCPNCGRTRPRPEARALPKVGDPVERVYESACYPRRVLRLADDGSWFDDDGGMHWRADQENQVPGWRRVEPASEPAKSHSGQCSDGRLCDRCWAVGVKEKYGQPASSEPTKPEPSEREQGAWELYLADIEAAADKCGVIRKTWDDLPEWGKRGFLAVYDRAGELFAAKAEERVKREFNSGVEHGRTLSRANRKEETSVLTTLVERLRDQLREVRSDVGRANEDVVRQARQKEFAEKERDAARAEVERLRHELIPRLQADLVHEHAEVDVFKRATVALSWQAINAFLKGHIPDDEPLVETAERAIVEGRAEVKRLKSESERNVNIAEVERLKGRVDDYRTARDIQELERSKAEDEVSRLKGYVNELIKALTEACSRTPGGGLPDSLAVARWFELLARIDIERTEKENKPTIAAEQQSIAASSNEAERKLEKVQELLRRWSRSTLTSQEALVAMLDVVKL